MRKLYTILVAILLNMISFAQSPDKMSYQAVVRDSGDNLVVSQAVGMQISILQGSTTGTAVYTETHTPTTNINGLVSVEIGTGTTTDDITAIDWSAGPFFIKTETDPAGGSSYSITGTSQLLSVPFALYSANTAGLDLKADINSPTFTGDVVFDTNGVSFSGGNVAFDNGQTFVRSAQVFNSAENIFYGPSVEFNTATNFATGTLNILNSPQTAGSVLTDVNGDGIATWQPVASVKELADADNNTKIQVEKSANENIIRFDLDGTEKWLMTGNRLESANTGGSVFIGNLVGNSDDLTDNYNIAIGDYSFTSNTSGYVNTAIGNGSLASNTTGNLNVSIGSAMYANISGTGNTASGFLALYNNITGNHNTAFGYEALKTYENGNQNVALGYKADVNADNLTNASAIGSFALVGQSNSMVLGSINGINGATANTNVGIGTTNPSASLDVTGTVKINDGTEGAGKVLTSDAAGNASWQATNKLLTTYEAASGPVNPLSADVTGSLIYTQNAEYPYFPEDLPDGFTCTIVNYSNYLFTSNILTTAVFVTDITGNAGDSSFTIPSGGTVNVYVMTIPNTTQKLYYIK